MENNKYNRFYIKKSVNTLMTQLLHHRVTGSVLSNEWYDTLVIHLSQREIGTEARYIFERIMTEGPEELKKEVDNLLVEIGKLKRVENVSIASSKPVGVRAAGKSLKNVALMQIFMLILSGLGIATIFVDLKSGARNLAYVCIGVLDIIFLFLSISYLYDAGNHLENS
jgi:hypothetical protein